MKFCIHQQKQLVLRFLIVVLYMGDAGWDGSGEESEDKGSPNNP